MIGSFKILLNVCSLFVDYLGTDHYFFIREVTIFGTCRQFFSEKKCASNNFFHYIYLFIRAIFYDRFEKRTGFL